MNVVFSVGLPASIALSLIGMGMLLIFPKLDRPKSESERGGGSETMGDLVGQNAVATLHPAAAETPQTTAAQDKAAEGVLSFLGGMIAIFIGTLVVSGLEKGDLGGGLLLLAIGLGCIGWSIKAFRDRKGLLGD